jgi:acetolactate synthase small subunit
MTNVNAFFLQLSDRCQQRQGAETYFTLLSNIFKRSVQLIMGGTVAEVRNQISTNTEVKKPSHTPTTVVTYEHQSAADASPTQLSISLASDSTITTSTSDQSSYNHYIDEVLSKKMQLFEIQMTSVIQGEIERTNTTNGMQLRNLDVTISQLQKETTSNSNKLNAKIDALLDLLAVKNG